MARFRKMRLTRILLAAFSAMVLAPSAFAQGCALCYTTAAAAGAAATRAIDMGILILLIPALLLFIAVLAFAARRAALSN